MVLREKSNADSRPTCYCIYTSIRKQDHFSRVRIVRHACQAATRLLLIDKSGVRRQYCPLLIRHLDHINPSLQQRGIFHRQNWSKNLSHLLMATSASPLLLVKETRQKHAADALLNFKETHINRPCSNYKQVSIALAITKRSNMQIMSSMYSFGHLVRVVLRYLGVHA